MLQHALCMHWDHTCVTKRNRALKQEAGVQHHVLKRTFWPFRVGYALVLLVSLAPN